MYGLKTRGIYGDDVRVLRETKNFNLRLQHLYVFADLLVVLGRRRRGSRCGCCGRQSVHSKRFHGDFTVAKFTAVNRTVRATSQALVNSNVLLEFDFG